MSSALPVPEKLILNVGNRSKNWENFQQKWQNYEVASELREKTEAVRLATLLTVIGDEGLAVYNSFRWNDEEKTVSTVLQKFSKYCNPETNEIYNRYVLMSRKQNDGEKIDDYIVVLENLSEKCNYGNLRDSIVRDVFVLGLKDVRTRESLLKEAKLDLIKAMNIARSIEKSQEQSKLISNNCEDINKIDTSMKRSRISDKKNEKTCKFCGNKHEFKKISCPAFGKKCFKCQRMNHFAMQCNQSENTNEIHTDNSDNENEFTSEETQYQIE